MENLSISIYLGGKVMDNMKEMRNKVQDGKYNLRGSRRCLFWNL